MIKYDPPRSDEQRLTFLRRALSAGTEGSAAGNGYMGRETLDAIAEFLAAFEPAVISVSERLSARIRAVRERTEALAQVELHTRDLWVGLKRRARRLAEPAEVLVLYQLPVDGDMPRPATPEGWLTLASQVIQGDAAAVAAGFSPMVNPSAAELQAALEAAQGMAGRVSAADQSYEQSQQVVAALRPRADELVTEVMAELRYSLRRKDPSNQRRIMRGYGARFRFVPDGNGDGLEPESEDTLGLDEAGEVAAVEEVEALVT